MRHYAACALVVGGCTVDVGKGTIESIVVDQPLDVDGTSPPVTLDLEFPLIAAHNSAICRLHAACRSEASHVARAVRP
jgi:hypothetical protein